MRPSYIATVDPKYFAADAEPVSGAVLLGVIGTLAYVHAAPTIPPRRFVGATLSDGQLIYERELLDGEDAPEGETVLVVGERPPLPWGEDYALVYDPAPEPFRWDTFAAACPDLAAPQGEDEDGNPLPPRLTPHGWAGE